MFRLSFKTENEAFSGENMRLEIARILRKVVRQVESDYQNTSGPILDYNGNKVGEWEMEEA